MAIQALEDAARIRALEGVPRLVFYAGQAVIDPRTGQPYVIKEYSDHLLMFLLRALRPHVYRERFDPSMGGGEAAVKVMSPPEITGEGAAA